MPGLKKKPSTSELLDWLKLLLNEDMPLDVLQNRDPTKATTESLPGTRVLRTVLGGRIVHDTGAL